MVSSAVHWRSVRGTAELESWEGCHRRCAKMVMGSRDVSHWSAVIPMNIGKHVYREKVAIVRVCPLLCNGFGSQNVCGARVMRMRCCGTKWSVLQCADAGIDGQV